METTICILVLYNPDLLLLNQVLGSIESQVDKIWISDNSITPISQDIFVQYGSKIIYNKMSGNIGIAAAQNYGIDYAIRAGFTYVYLLDQDSISPEGIIANLMKCYRTLTNKGFKIGAIGPRPFNRSENKEYIGTIKKGRKITDEITEVTELISSASLIRIDTLKRVGNMDATLFIDGVDHEWCWRANSIGAYRFFINERVILSHQLGEGDRWFLWRKVAIPTPFRVYYQYRNFFKLLGRNYVPLYWKISRGVKYLVKIFYYPLCISPRKEYLKNIFRGIRDGLF